MVTEKEKKEERTEKGRGEKYPENSGLVHGRKMVNNWNYQVQANANEMVITYVKILRKYIWF